MFRFYFVSNQTLIDILSNGNNPVLIVSEYLGDLFDGIKKLKLREKDGVPQPIGIGMISKIRYSDRKTCNVHFF